jgi:hypothetical protein
MRFFGLTRHPGKWRLGVRMARKSGLRVGVLWRG